jgi:hypothetical protein
MPDKNFSWIARSCDNASYVHKVESIIKHSIIFGIIGLKLTIRGMLGSVGLSSKNAQGLVG